MSINAVTILQQLLLSLESLTGIDQRAAEAGLSDERRIYRRMGSVGDRGCRDGMGCMTRVEVMKECRVIMPVVLLDEDASGEVMKSCK